MHVQAGPWCDDGAGQVPVLRADHPVLLQRHAADWPGHPRRVCRGVRARLPRERSPAKEHLLFAALVPCLHSMDQPSQLIPRLQVATYC